MASSILWFLSWAQPCVFSCHTRKKASSCEFDESKCPLLKMLSSRTSLGSISGMASTELAVGYIFVKDFDLCRGWRFLRPIFSRQASSLAIRFRSDGARLEKSKLLGTQSVVDDRLRFLLKLLARKDLRKRNEPMSRNWTSSEIVGRLRRRPILLENGFLLVVVECLLCRFCLAMLCLRGEEALGFDFVNLSSSAISFFFSSVVRPTLGPLGSLFSSTEFFVIVPNKLLLKSS